MSRRLLIICSILLFSTCSAPAQAPSPEAMTAARSLVTTLGLADQYKALLPVILLGLKPVLTQERPEMERAFDAALPKMSETYAPYYTAMVDAAATVYANNFTVDELRDIEAFYSRPAGKKLLEKSQAIAQQTTQVGQETGRKATEALRARLTELLRQTAH
jgi:uncharacterized protein